MSHLSDYLTFKATIKDKDGALTTPSAQVITLIDPLGYYNTSGSSPTVVSAGVYNQSFTIPETGSQGTWKLMWTATISGGTKTSVIEVSIVPKDGVIR